MVAEKSYRFAVRIVKLCQYLQEEKHEFVLSQQVEKSGTSIRANITEGQQGQSRADFISKLSIALKESSETKYWLSLLHDAGYLTDREFQSIYSDCIEIEKTLDENFENDKIKLPHVNNTFFKFVVQMTIWTTPKLSTFNFQL